MASGWTPVREVPTDGWVNQLQSEGFAVLPEATRILAEFGGLTVIPQKSPSDAYLAEILRFDPVLASSGEFDRVDYWERRLGMRLSPIAETGGGSMLLIAEDGRVFSCRDRMLWLHGTSFENALENTLIIAKRRPTEYASMHDSGPSPTQRKK
jgi:hypothetical protein